MAKLPKPPAWDQLGIEGCFSWENESDFLLDTIEIVKPNNILEVGFFRGASAFTWLQLSSATLTSVDPMFNTYDPLVQHDGKIENVQKLKDHFGTGRFSFVQKDSKKVFPDLNGQKFDLFFIDGDHTEAGARNDFTLALALRVPYILVDDFVTTVESVYNEEFTNYFEVIKVYPRVDQFMGKPIPIYLLKNKTI
jgi:predicted O-methyltransferase YrrM